MVESDENKLIAELVKFQLGIMEKTYENITLLLSEYNKYNQLTDYEIEVFGNFYKFANAMHILQPTYIIKTGGDSEENQYWLTEGMVGYSYYDDKKLMSLKEWI